jgi:hypothetical protein
LLIFEPPVPERGWVVFFVGGILVRTSDTDLL